MAHSFAERTLQDVLTLDQVNQLANAKSIERGRAYFHQGVVGRLEFDDVRVKTKVQGTHSYRVSLSVAQDGELGYSCSCPVGLDGDFCKHAVAVAFAWLENAGEEVFHEEEAKGGATRRPRQTKAEQLGEYLETQEAPRLREWLKEAALRDKVLRDKLLFSAKADKGSSIKELESLVKNAVRQNRFLEWNEVGEYVDRLEMMTDALEGQVSRGDVRVVELIELAFSGVEKSLENIDDSNGELQEIIARFNELHIEACLRLRPEPVPLAKRMFAYRMQSDWGFFYSDLDDYDEVLGEDGLAQFYADAWIAWEKLPVLPPRNNSDRRRLQGVVRLEDIPSDSSWSNKRFFLERLLLGILPDTNVQGHINILQKDLSSPDRFLKIASFLRDHDQRAEALDWAERGLKSFDKDTRLEDLRDFCIEEYRLAGDADKVEAMAWESYLGSRRFDVSDYEKWCKVMRQLGREDQAWPRVRLYYEEGMKTGGKHGKDYLVSLRSHLMMIQLHDGRHEDAWKTYCSGEVWGHYQLSMAKARGKTHPHEAIAIYDSFLPERIADGVSRGGKYGDAIEILKAIRALRHQAGETELFVDQREKLRQVHKAKRNFIKLLDEL